MRKYLAALALPLALAACGDDQAAAPTKVSESPRTATIIPTPTEEPRDSMGFTAHERAVAFPKGYPKVVQVSSLPSHMRGDFGSPTALAVAPGVWAEITPGSTGRDAFDAGVLSGYCASKVAYERQFLGGQQTAGTCW